MAKRPRKQSDTGTLAVAEIDPPKSVTVPGKDVPTKKINPRELASLGATLDKLFIQYRSDRQVAELKWLRNQRQYLGIYDPEIEKELGAVRSMAYPRLTRVKVISFLSRLMNLMFPGNERNWELQASPWPDIKPEDVQQAIQAQQARDQAAGVQPTVDIDYVMNAIQQLAQDRAEKLSLLIDDQLEELGGDQTYDYIQINRRALLSGILYGLGVVRGPFVVEGKSTKWSLGPNNMPVATTTTAFKPMFEVLPIWDFFPDMSCKTFASMDGYFIRNVMSRSQVRALADRSDFFSDSIDRYLRTHPQGNYRAMNFESELRAMGVKAVVNEQKTETSKFEVLVWHGPVSGHFLRLAGVEIDDDKLEDEIDAEVWMIEGNVIKCDMNPWKKLGVDVKTIHTFLFDEDDTSPVGSGLPNVMRDSQMAVSALTRMFLDNASVICGPNLELNTQLLRPDQDLTSMSAYKFWYRDDDGQTSQYPAVRNVQIDSHLQEIQAGIKMFLEFADAETFVGPATGGDMSKTPSEPMRTAAGASMLRGDAALPFKDVVRNFDSFTQSMIESLVMFNRQFNPDKAPEGDYNVIARGATSLIAKEVRGMQVDALAQTLTPEEKMHVDERKLVEARLKVRDLGDLLVSKDEAERRKAQAGKAAQDQQDQARELAEAQVRNLLSQAFKNIAQGNKNSANADATAVTSALTLLEQGVKDALENFGHADDGSGKAGAVPPAKAAPRTPGNPRSTVLSLPPRIAAAGGGGQPSGLPA